MTQAITRRRARTPREEFQEELAAWKEGTREYVARLPARSLRAARKVATYDVGDVAKAAYRSSAGKEVRDLVKSTANAVVGIPTRLLRNIVRGAHYLAKGTTTGLLEVLPRKFYQSVEDAEAQLEGKLSEAHLHKQREILLTPQEIQGLEQLAEQRGSREVIGYLSRKLHQAEVDQHSVRFSVQRLEEFLRHYAEGRTNMGEIHRYRAAAAVISFVVALLSFDQVRVTGMAVSDVAGGYDYYSLFGFLFLALTLILLMMGHRKRR